MKRMIIHRYKFIVYLIEIFLFLIFALLSYNFFIKPTGNKDFYIPKKNLDVIYQTLKENHYAIYPIDKILLSIFPLPDKGWYHIANFNTGKFSFLYNLHTYKVPTKHVKIYAGESANEVCSRVASILESNITKLLHAYKQTTRYGDGDILAGVYILSKKIDENAIINHLFNTSKNKILSFDNKYNNIYNTNEYKKLLTIASIIQKETNSIEEMPLISSVIYNRLKKNMRLQMDGTLNYGKYSHQIINSDRIKNDTSRYNTYKYKGLPPTPLCTVSLEALKSAENPALTNYLFFMLNKEKKHDFTDNYKEHLKNIKKFKSQKEDINITLSDINETNISVK